MCAVNHAAMLDCHACVAGFRCVDAVQSAGIAFGSTHGGCIDQIASQGCMQAQQDFFLSAIIVPRSLMHETISLALSGHIQTNTCMLWTDHMLCNADLSDDGLNRRRVSGRVRSGRLDQYNAGSLYTVVTMDPNDEVCFCSALITVAKAQLMPIVSTAPPAQASAVLHLNVGAYVRVPRWWLLIAIWLHV